MTGSLEWVHQLADQMIEKLRLGERNLERGQGGRMSHIDARTTRATLEQAVEGLTLEQKLQLADLTHFRFGAPWATSEMVYSDLRIGLSDLHAWRLLDMGAVVGLYDMMWARLIARYR